ncbi:hypothetical protein [Ligilactobacillus acidipiscis]|uniref:Uncharacterized protein n=1 Tax=Ligilactobacillus acidipiscis TaxID=89059 RepID=A0A1K1KQB5_9LACO|nr:hypothetical protein [Ligilactobacillus acidipiscis]SFV41055.1 hypothetical protein LAC1533_1634 [Ligilactobacillus acidipiscis]
MAVYKLKIDAFADKFDEFISDSNKNSLLIRGFYDVDKLLSVFNILSKNKYCHKGVIVLGNVTIKHEQELFQRIFRNKLPTFNLSDEFDLADLTVSFTKWGQNTEFPYGQFDDFALFYPVESVLFNAKDTAKFVKAVKGSKAKKNILITTNDFTKKAEELYEIVDDCLILDTVDLNEKHKKIFNTIEQNIKAKHNELPY